MIYLYAMRRRRAEGENGDAEVLRWRRGGSKLGEAAKHVERPPRRASGRLGSTGGLAETPGVEARLLRRSVEAERSWRDRPRRRRGVCVAERAGGGAGVW